MELLATVDWLIHRAGYRATVPHLREGLSKWPTSRAAARRKQKLFTDKMVKASVERLSAHGLATIPAKPVFG